jgi:hypothetical protein
MMVMMLMMMMVMMMVVMLMMTEPTTTSSPQPLPLTSLQRPQPPHLRPCAVLLPFHRHQNCRR